jgi:hypothetical protein
VTAASAGGEAPGLLIDISLAQRGVEDGRATPVEECAAALVAMPGAVRALLLDPGAPIPGGLHSRLFGSGLLRWNTATSVRRAAAAGPVAYVAFAEGAVPPHVERLGVPVVTVAAEGARAAGLVLAAARGLGGTVVSRLRVAVVGAMPPSAAPCAAMNARLVEALRPRCDVEVVEGDGLAGTTRAAAYDAVVHLLGGAAGEVAVLRSARRVPGVLWMHHESLAEVHRAEAGGSAPMLASLLRRLYGERAPLPLLDALDRGDASAFDAAAERRFGVLMTGDVVRAAHAVVVPSESAARRLRLDQGAGGPCPPVSVCTAAADAVAAADHLLSVVADVVAGQAA